MVLKSKATSGIATRAEGQFANCGPGSDNYELSYNCQGPACSSLDADFQNIVCHKDGSNTLVCSNDVKCRSDTSYLSNFTFSQNEPDPWNPTMENEPDTWVHQDQHVLVGSCAKFSLTSDGTKQGTRVSNEGQVDTCPNEGGLFSSSSSAGLVATSTSLAHAGATKKPLVFKGTGSRHVTSKSSLLLAFFLLILILPEAQATAVHHNHEKYRQRPGSRIRAASQNARAFAEEFRADIARRASSQNTDGNAFAQDLVAGVILSVCQSHFEGSGSSRFNPGIVKNCIASIYNNDRLSQPALRFLAVFRASLLCDYVVSETYPNGQDFVPDACEGLEDLASKVLTDISTPVLSASTTPSSPSTRTGVSSPIFAAIYSPKVQESDQLFSAVSQLGASPLDTQLTFDTLSALASRSGASSSSHQPTDAPVTDRLADGRLLSDAQLTAELPPVISSSLASSHPSLTLAKTSTKLSSFGPALSDLAVSESPVAEIVQTDVSSAKVVSSGLPIPGKSSIGSAVGTSASSTSQTSPTIVASQSVRSNLGTSELLVNPTEEASIQIVASSEESLSLGAVPSSSSQASISNAGLSLNTGSGAAASLRTESRLASIPSSGVVALPLTSIDSLSSKVPTISASTSSSTLTDTPLLSPVLANTAASETLPQDVSSSNVLLSSALSLDELPSNSRASAATQTDLTSELVSDVAIRTRTLNTALPATSSQFSGSSTMTTISSSAADISVDVSLGPNFLKDPNASALVSGDLPSSVPNVLTPTTAPLAQTISASSRSSDDTRSHTSLDATVTTETVNILIPSSKTTAALISTESVIVATATVEAVLSTTSATQTGITLTSTTHTAELGSSVSSRVAISIFATLDVSVPSLSTVGSDPNRNPASVSNEAFLVSKSLNSVPADDINLSTADRTVSSRTRSSQVNYIASSPLPSSSLSVPFEATESRVRTIASILSTLMATSGSINEKPPQLPRTSTGLSFVSFTSILTKVNSNSSSTMSHQHEPATSIVISSIPPSAPLLASPTSSRVNFVPPALNSSTAAMPSSQSIDTRIRSARSSYSSFSSTPNVLMTATIARPSALPITSKSSTSLGEKLVSIADKSTTTVKDLPSTSLTTTIPLPSKSIVSSSPGDPGSTPLCIPESTAPNFCLGSGCVSFMTNKAHCGACNKVCQYECSEGICICPDLSIPNANNECSSIPGLGTCADGYTRNEFRICAPLVPSTRRTSTPVTTQRPAVTTIASLPASSKPSFPKLSLAASAWTNIVVTEYVYCPSGLPDVCNGRCVNTRSARDHCGGCGKYCSGNCINEHCLASSTQSHMQPGSTGAVITISSPKATPVPVPVTSTVEVAVYILKGLAGLQ